MLDEADIKKLTDVLATKHDVVHVGDRLAIVELKIDRMIEVLDKNIPPTRNAQSRISGLKRA